MFRPASAVVGERIFYGWGAPVTRALAVVPQLQESSRPDVAWIKNHVSVFEVAKALGLRIRHRRAKCWRPENHTHGDTEPSLHFYERKNRVRCFVCDMRGGHSCIDLVMGNLGVTFGDAVRWIAERFTVPNVKVGRPLGQREAQPAPYRVGIQGSEFEFLVRTGMFGKLPAPERSILVALAHFRDPESGLTQLSYAGIMRYAGVSSTATVNKALKQLARLHAIEIHRGLRVGVTRTCSSYRVTIEDPKFVDLCNEVCQSSRAEIAQERDYRKGLRSQREGESRPRLTLNTAIVGGLRPPDPPSASPSREIQNHEEKPSTCEGLNLSSLSEVLSNKTLQAVTREIAISAKGADLDARWMLLQRQAQEIQAKYAVRA